MHIKDYIIILGDYMLINMIELLKTAKKQKQAVPHFNINNLEWTKFILEEANRLQKPVILGVSEGASKYMGGYETVYSIVSSLIKHLNINIDVVLHLDHGSSYEECVRAIDAGFTSVMIDASKYSLDENINITKKVVEYAHERNVSVEAEIGHVGGTEDDMSSQVVLADIDECLKFVEDTNIDALAPAIGNAHGIYKSKPNLDFELTKRISELTDLPLVLHGGTGINDGDILKLINCGITKININTELQLAWANRVRKFLDENPDVYDPRKIIKAGESAIKEVIREKVKLFENR